MHGLGNDFMIIDARNFEPKLNYKLIKALSNRNFGVGFDQLVLIYEPTQPNTDCFLKFWNSDGSKASTCGNATRCVAALILHEKRTTTAVIQTEVNLLTCKRNKQGVISVNMGTPKLLWNDIPLAIECDTLNLPLDRNPVATSMGNPHCTFFVENLESEDLDYFGNSFENHQLFTNKTNVQLAQILSVDKIKVKVWERGVGKTLASGSSACAVAVAAFRRGLTGKKTQIIMDGGQLEIFWSCNGVWMAGETRQVFEGTVSNDFLWHIERV